MGGDIHQAIAAVVALAATLQIAQRANFARGDSGFDRPERPARPALVMHGHLYPLLFGFGQNLIGFCQSRADRLFDIDVDPVIKYPERQVVMEFRASGNRDDIRGLCRDHPIQIIVARRDTQLAAEGLEPFGYEVAQPHYLGAWMLVVGAGSGRAPASTAQNGDAIVFHCSPSS